MEMTPPSRRLGCGRDIDQVWDGIDREPDAHERGCPFCTAARADLRRLQDATRSLRQEELDDPALEPSPGVTERILAIARAEVRRGRRLPLDRPGPDQTSDLTVSEQAVATVIRRVGDRAGRVEIRSCAVRLVDPGDPSLATDLAEDAGDAAADVPPGIPSDVTVSVRVSVLSTAGNRASIPAVVQELRDGIIGAVRQEVGVNVVQVDVVVEDVHGD
ncbi:hypothetical protein FHX74_003894 [Friedmanniella endophytica]|uniref:Asp23/Gls24 family envelope stress response protein n=1 Tax=Microlunatus kandeliicorticis TaxID=1759536 RepID=A0A7W3IVW4_9ACTN|nr:hypothetical protein [Microlunatus kandeliicorticis]MBA8796241.1 hypothetical protein [Microlunatus kandeliicorticis]